MKKRINLHLFDGAAAAGAAGAGDSGVTGRDAGGQNGQGQSQRVIYGKQAEGIEDAAQSGTEGNEPDFDSLIKGKYKKDFHDRVQKIINGRFAESEQLKTRLDSYSPIMQILSERYGTQMDDMAGIKKALEADDAYLQNEAVERGMTLDQMRSIKKIERENQELRRRERANEEQRRVNEIQNKWKADAEQVKGIYQDFDLDTELQMNPEFGKLLSVGVDVKTAYEVIHKDEIIGGAMAYTAEQVTRKVSQNIQNRHKRPTENGMRSASPAVYKSDVKTLTRADRKEIEKRVARGERVVF